MKIVEIRELSVPLEGQISNAVVSFAGHDVSLVAVVSDVIRDGRPVIGFGFNSIGRFAHEGIIGNRIAPRILAASPDSLANGKGFDCEAVYRTAMLNEKPGGHGDRASAVAAIELAFWDLNAKLADEPAYATIARKFGREPVTKVRTYAAGGYYYPSDGVGRLKDELRGYADLGFDAFKIKVGGAPMSDDLKRIEAALEICGDGSRLAVDVNGRFALADALAFAAAIEPYELRWYEEVGDPLDYELNRALAASYAGPIATGENLFSSQDVTNLLRYAGMRPGRDIFQMDAGLSYGLTEFGRIIDLLETNGFSREYAYPHGGHLINLHIACGLGLGGCESYLGIFQPFGGYSSECAIENGSISPAEFPGFGLEAKPELRPFLDRLSA